MTQMSSVTGAAVVGSTEKSWVLKVKVGERALQAEQIIRVKTGLVKQFVKTRNLTQDLEWGNF